MGTFVGRDVTVEFAIAEEDATVGSLTWLELGMMRGKSLSSNWDTADVTGDKSPAYTRQNLVTFKQVEFSGDGVTYDDAAFNQNDFRTQAISPGSTTSNQPKVWFRLTLPGVGSYVGPFIVTSWEDTGPYDDGATWSLSALSNGDVSFTPV
jgi:predicted secreted protein